jgi:hypothetical protein
VNSAPRARLPARGAIFTCLLSCTPAAPTRQEPPELDPVDRRLALGLVVADPQSALRAAALPDGARAPALLFPGPDGGTRTAEAFRADLDALRLALPEIPVGVGAMVPALPQDGGPWCFDPAALLDPGLVEHRDQVRVALDGLGAAFLLVDPWGEQPVWDAACSCVACEGEGLDPTIRRASVAWSALEEAGAGLGVEPWFLADAPDGVPAPGVEAALDSWLPREPHDSGLSVATPATRGAGGPWAVLEPRAADAQWRRVATWVDLSHDDAGPTQALLVDAVVLADQVRTARRGGAVGAFARVDGELRSARTDWGGANVHVLGWLHQNIDRTPEAALSALVTHRTGLLPDSVGAQATIEALRETGLALDLATHPLGIGVIDRHLGLPSGFPLSFVDPRPWEPAWEDRWTLLHAPSLADLVQIGQWGEEAMDITRRARATLELATPQIAAADAAELGSGLLALDLSVRAWALVVRADATLRHVTANPGEDALAWLRSDGAALDALAIEAEQAVQAGSLQTPFPAVPDRLRSLAAAIRVVTGEGAATERGFPRITSMETAWLDGRANLRWRTEPSGSGELWTGVASPVLETQGPSGPGPAAQWDGWLDGLPPATRLVWRACSVVDEVRVCTADRVLHTPD